MRKEYFAVFVLLALHLYFLTNLQFTAWPEMLSYAYLRNHGFLLYKDMIYPYPPLLTFILSWFYSVFGYGLEVLQTIAWANILTGALLVFVLTNTLIKRGGLALVALGIYVLLQPFFEGNMLWFDLGIVPPVLLGTILLLKYLEKEGDKWIILAGFSLAVAALVKQTTAIFLVFVAVFLLAKQRSFRAVGKLAMGPVVLLVPFLFRLVQEGAVLDFLRWTLLYPMGEWGKYPNYVQMGLSLRELFLMGILFFPLITLIIVRRKVLLDPRLQLLLLFLLGALVAIYPRFSLFHFQLALAFLVVIWAFLFKEWKVQNVILVSGLFLLVLFPLVHYPVLNRDWQKEARFYGTSDKALGKRIRELTDPQRLVFLQGLHSGLYVMADRLPPKRWSDNFGWYLEIPGVQEEILNRWGNGPPGYIIWHEPSNGNWFDLGVYQPQKIVSWLKTNYTKKEDIENGVSLWQKKN